MFDTVTVRVPARSRLSRVAVGAVLALWCVFALASGDARAFCLDLRGGCSPSTAAPTGTCHDQAPADSADPSCDSCVDILVHEDASVGGSRPEHELRTPAAAHHFGCAGDAFPAAVGTIATSPASLIDRPSPRPAIRTAVLRI